MSWDTDDMGEIVAKTFGVASNRAAARANFHDKPDDLHEVCELIDVDWDELTAPKPVKKGRKS